MKVNYTNINIKITCDCKEVVWLNGNWGENRPYFCPSCGKKYIYELIVKEVK